MTAYVEVSADADLGAIAATAGSFDVNQRRYEDGFLYVEGVTQSDLDAAVANFDSTAHLHSLIVGDIAARRYLAETSGITVGGMFIDTGRDSQALITGAALSAFIDPTYLCNWKTPDGFVQIDAPTLIAVSKAVRQHVQACFDRESELLSALEAGEYAPDMLEKGWPA